MNRLAFHARQSDAIAIIPDPAKPGDYARFQFYRTIQPGPMVVAIEGSKVRSA